LARAEGFVQSRQFQPASFANSPWDGYGLWPLSDRQLSGSDLGKQTLGCRRIDLY
jgi:hypothetical protein